MNLYRIGPPKHLRDRDMVSLTLQGTNTGVRPMNRKSFIAAAAAVLGVVQSVVESNPPSATGTIQIITPK